ncbi:hypothetical protein PAAG_12693 [Paracoccidioides lutzii Pb01]|uniref:Uncharacterized protein n=1 Tax=Paracoccidioides lutzii (strain ATCC MYA-826 / Pb01) TaxID=502779 RepID=A0A0A2UZK1_PARBA|nr:hypothetical protein PAAG_12693 [Paracoccidioides lutzii Pb01]KGQ00653.1 hypothetical protein PAAG_12693 [Paracoccidioides lutzii Pb01]
MTEQGREQGRPHPTISLRRADPGGYGPRRLARALKQGERCGVYVGMCMHAWIRHGFHRSTSPPPTDRDVHPVDPDLQPASAQTSARAPRAESRGTTPPAAPAPSHLEPTRKPPRVPAPVRNVLGSLSNVEPVSGPSRPTLTWKSSPPRPRRPPPGGQKFCSTQHHLDD